MKVTAALLAALVLTAGGTGFVIFSKVQENKALSAKMLSQEQTAAAEAARLQSELAAAKAHSDEDLKRLQGELAAAKQKSDDEAKQLQAEIADMKAQGQTAKQQSGALASLMEKVNTAETLINVQLSRLLSDTSDAEKSLLTTPSSQNFVALKKSYESDLRLIEASSKALGECETYIAGNAADLKPFAQQVDAVSGRVSRGKISLSTAKARVEQCVKAARESTFAALANTAGWQPSDLSVEAGEHLAIQAKGTWQWARQLANAVVGPEGTSGQANYRVNPTFNNGALLLRIRGSESRYLGIGHVLPDRPGRVEFEINDSDTGDNKGTIDVTMWVVLPLTVN